MTIPDYQTIMLPLLELVRDGEEHSMRALTEALANKFDLTEEERKELLPSGRQPTFDNRVGWARTYVKKAGLLKSRRRGYIEITERGLSVLKNGPPRIDINFLNQFDEFVEFRTRKDESTLDTDKRDAQTPEEEIEEAYQQLRDALAAELLDTIKENSPSFFEELVVDLLVKMGYGGTRKDAGQAIGKAGDEGIDGIIKEDRLGLDIIYIQAKRWDSSVGRPEIQKFAGALQGQRAQKGIFITTSTFTQDALAYVNVINNKIILIDGDELAKLMIDFDVAVSTVATYKLKQVDTDYFTGV